MTPLPTQSHYPDTELIHCCPILVLMSTRLSRDKYKFCKSLVWLDWHSNARPSTREASVPTEPMTATGSLVRCGCRTRNRMDQYIYCVRTLTPFSTKQCLSTSHCEKCSQWTEIMISVKLLDLWRAPCTLERLMLGLNVCFFYQVG